MTYHDNANDMIPSFDQFLPCLMLSAVQFLAALPWLWAIDSRLFRSLFTKPSGLATFGGLIIGLALAGMRLAALINSALTKAPPRD